MVTLEHTPHRPTDRSTHVSTCAHTLALLGCEHVLTWVGRSVGRCGVCSSVIIVLVCYFLVIFYKYFYTFFGKRGGGGAVPPSPPLRFICLWKKIVLWGLCPQTPPASVFEVAIKKQHCFGHLIWKEECGLF